ncbi:MAG: peptidase S41, partial [Dinghuibacter sp.]|nr:peptidase S41 [Dinghuibacter sp.]
QHIPTYKAWGAFLTPQDTLQAKPEWGMLKEEMTKSYLMSKDLYFYQFPYEPTVSGLKKKRIVAPVVVLIGNGTASAAEDFLIYADPLPNFTFMGDKTYGSTGQPYLFDLPGGGRARVCTKKDVYPDGKEFIGYGISPDIYVRYTLEDYIQNNDPVLKSAVKYLSGK